MSTFQERFKGQIAVTGRDGSIGGPSGPPRVGRRSAPAARKERSQTSVASKPSVNDLVALDAQQQDMLFPMPAHPSRSTASLLGPSSAGGRSTVPSQEDDMYGYKADAGYGQDVRQVTFQVQDDHHTHAGGAMGGDHYDASQGYGQYGFSSSPGYTPGGGMIQPGAYSEQAMYQDPYANQMDAGAYGAYGPGGGEVDGYRDAYAPRSNSVPPPAGYAGYVDDGSYGAGVGNDAWQNNGYGNGYAMEQQGYAADPYGYNGEHGGGYGQQQQQQQQQHQSVPQGSAGYGRRAADSRGSKTPVNRRSQSVNGGYTPSDPSARRRPNLTTSQKMKRAEDAKKKQQQEEYERKQREREESDPLAFGKRGPKGQGYKPKTGRVDLRPKKLGGLGPDLNNPELLEKKARRERMLAFSKSVKTVNQSEMPSAQPPRNRAVSVNKPNELNARERALKFAESVKQRAKTRDGRLKDQSPAHKTPKAGRRSTNPLDNSSTSTAKSSNRPPGVTRDGTLMKSKPSRLRFGSDNEYGYDDDFENDSQSDPGSDDANDTSLAHLEEMERQHLQRLAKVENIRKEMGAY